MQANLDAWAKLVSTVVAGVSFPGYQFHLSTEGGHLLLRVVFEGPDVTENTETQAGRPWVIEFGAHPHQIVQTCFLALMTSVEHRTRERFLWNGRAVMSPHRTAAHMEAGTPLASMLVGIREAGVPEHRLTKEIK